jgi:excisionase family DNA binding protein
MTPSLNDLPDAMTPSVADSQLARESSWHLTNILSSETESLRISVHPDSGREESIVIPLPALRLLTEILTEMAKGNAVALIPVRAELTAQQAADLLNVSRPYLIELLESGAIPFRKDGTHRRVLFEDVMAYKRKNNGERLKALEELSALDQELGLGY